MAKLGKARPIKTSYTADEIGTIVSIGASFGLEFVGAGELLLGWIGRLFGETSSIALEQVVSEGASNISKIIDVGKQGKHIVGHNNYLSGRSILTESAQELLDAFHSGNVTSSQVINPVKIRVNFGKIIGNFVKDGISTPTTNGIVINAKNGVHIVPSSPL